MELLWNGIRIELRSENIHERAILETLNGITETQGDSIPLDIRDSDGFKSRRVGIHSPHTHSK